MTFNRLLTRGTRHPEYPAHSEWPAERRRVTVSSIPRVVAKHAFRGTIAGQGESGGGEAGGGGGGEGASNA